jgi:hypothetical protein
LIGERTEGAEIQTDGDRWEKGRLILPEARGAQGEKKKKHREIK